jgi:hypothetical protein
MEEKDFQERAAVFSKFIAGRQYLDEFVEEVIIHRHSRWL